MSETNKTSSTQRFIDSIDELYKKLKGGESLVVIFNGVDTLTLWSNNLVAVRSEKMSALSAKEVKEHLKTLDFEIRNFRISQYAFEAIAKRPRINPR